MSEFPNLEALRQIGLEWAFALKGAPESTGEYTYLGDKAWFNLTNVPKLAAHVVQFIHNFQEKVNR